MTRLRFDPSTRVLEAGQAVLGGEPTRLLRLTAAGGRLVAGWRAGDAVGDAPAARRLAQRLLDAGIAHPEPVAGQWTTDDVAVVIPTRDRPELLAACLAAVGPAQEVVVVDDGSSDPHAIAAVALAGGARVVRVCPDAGPSGAGPSRATPSGATPSGAGPAAARNAGLAATAAPLIAFVDSDTRPSSGWLAPLVAHFTDERTGAVAPRISVPPGAGAIAAYERVRSPLDLGRAGGVAGPGRRIGFVSAAALVARRDAIAGGFDASMRYGEDVDLVWRLSASGWTVRYEPDVCVEHPHRGEMRAWLWQRLAYGASAGPLDQRHRGVLRHVVVPAWTLPAVSLAFAGRPRGALAAAAAGTATVVVRLPAEARRELAPFVARAQVRAARQLLDAAWRAYPPVVLATAITSRRARRLAAAGLAVSVAADWLERRPRLDPLRFGALRLADDLAYATGLWLGCLRARRAGPLVPCVAGARSSSHRTDRR